MPKKLGYSVLALGFLGPALAAGADSVLGGPPIHPLVMALLVCVAFGAAGAIWGLRDRARPSRPGDARADYRERVRMLKDLMGLDRIGF